MPLIYRISLNQSILPHWILNHRSLIHFPFYSAHHHFHLHHTRSHLSRWLQLALMQVDALEEQVLCGVQGDSDHQPTPILVQSARGGASGRDGVLHIPSSWHGGSVDVDYQHLMREARASVPGDRSTTPFFPCKADSSWTMSGDSSSSPSSSSTLGGHGMSLVVKSAASI